MVHAVCFHMRARGAAARFMRQTPPFAVVIGRTAVVVNIHTGFFCGGPVCGGRLDGDTDYTNTVPLPKM